MDVTVSGFGGGTVCLMNLYLAVHVRCQCGSQFALHVARLKERLVFGDGANLTFMFREWSCCCRSAITVVINLSTIVAFLNNT